MGFGSEARGERGRRTKCGWLAIVAAAASGVTCWVVLILNFLGLEARTRVELQNSQTELNFQPLAPNTNEDILTIFMVWQWIIMDYGVDRWVIEFPNRQQLQGTFASSSSQKDNGPCITQRSESSGICSESCWTLDSRGGCPRLPDKWTESIVVKSERVT